MCRLRLRLNPKIGYKICYPNCSTGQTSSMESSAAYWKEGLAVGVTLLKP